MSFLPETRPSLILRLPNAADAEAWEEFTTLYTPAVYRLARRKGLQHADAQNLVQDVLAAVARSVEHWKPDPARGKFRSWLFTIARNLTLNHLTRPKHKGMGTGDTQTLRWLENQPAASSADTALFDLEYRREIFRRAADRVKDRVKPSTWQAFWLSVVEDLSIDATAQKLRLSPGAVYIARSRVMAKLQDEAAGLAGQGNPL